ncbi:hypothetical protein [Lacinutrix sp. Bg11-31]|uniref:hypothetical protein n=1 Tax=Lacinutrix sp. Bg11-31 TaxID=2057808 RepID=UPI000C30D20E|nr:hypothetical protein [Lacinutrix sp. Bg11-31]AUC82812.1 hypothetical protein CW733_12035 [Lacinutrix sp. Bg11-31]
MKKAIQKSLLLVAVLVTMINYASNVSPLNEDENIKKIVLTLNNVKEGQQLLIKDDNQVILYKEAISKSGDYKKGFDLTALPNGDYYFELNKDIVIEVIPFKVNYNVVTFNKDNKMEIFKPFVTLKNNTVFVSLLTLDAKPVSLSIYYNNDGSMELIHKETIINAVNIQKSYKLDATKTGSYIFSINTEGRAFSNSINL